MATIENPQVQFGEIIGPGYYANLEFDNIGWIISSVGYIQKGEKRKVYRNIPFKARTIFTSVDNMLGEFLLLLIGSGAIIPNKDNWTNNTDDNYAFISRGINIGGIVPNDPFQWLSVKAYDYMEFLRDPDHDGINKDLLIRFIAYLNLWGLIPGLWVGDPFKAFAQTVPILNASSDVDPDYPEHGIKGPIDYIDAKHLMHYFYPNHNDFILNLNTWFIPFLRAKGGMVLATEEEIINFCDSQGTNDNVTVDLSTYKLNF